MYESVLRVFFGGGEWKKALIHQAGAMPAPANAVDAVDTLAGSGLHTNARRQFVERIADVEIFLSNGWIFCSNNSPVQKATSFPRC